MTILADPNDPFKLVQRIGRLERVLDGENDTDNRGLRARVKLLEEVAQEIHDLKVVLRFAIAAMSTLGVGNLIMFAWQILHLVK